MLKEKGNPWISGSNSYRFFSLLLRASTTTTTILLLERAFFIARFRFGEAAPASLEPDPVRSVLGVRISILDSHFLKIRSFFDLALGAFGPTETKKKS